MGKIVPGKDKITVETSLDQLLDEPMTVRTGEKQTMFFPNMTIRDAFRQLAWKMLWQYGRNLLEGREDSFAYGDIFIQEDAEIKVTFFRKKFTPKEPGGP
jgi:hypothetical protein